MRRAFVFARSVRHTKLRQLVSRVRLVLKRRALVLLARVADPRANWSKRPGPAVRTVPPQPVFAPRRELVAGEGEDLRVVVVNRERPLVFPMDWRPPGWDAGTRLALLHLHSMEWAESLDDENLVRAVDDWIANVAPYRDGYWHAEWNACALSIRTVVWMQQIARRARRIPRAFVERAAISIVEQMRFLVRNLETDLGGNHVLKDAKALVWAGRFFEGPEADAWSRAGARILARELDEQILADGLHFERSPAYHAQVCADLLECRSVLDGDVALRLDAVLGRAMQALADTTHPDGRTSLFNDGGLHMAYAPGDVLAAFARLGGAAVVPSRHVALEHAGYYGWRLGKSLVLADCGTIAPDHLPAHGHGDALAFEWTLHGERVIVDAGVFEYDAGPMRALARGTRTHNTVTLDDHDQCEFWASFRMGRRAQVVRRRWQPRDDGFVLEGTHDGFAHLPGEPIHRRILRVQGGEIRIEDHIEGGSGQACVARLLLHPTARVVQSADGVVTITQGRVQVRVVSESPITLETAWWCPDMGLKLKTRQIVVSYGTAPRVGAILLRSLVSAAPSAAAWRNLERPVSSS